MIAPFPPGGSTDVLCRRIAQKLAASFGRQVIVDNRPGAGGSIGHEAAARANDTPERMREVVKAEGPPMAKLLKAAGIQPH